MAAADEKKNGGSSSVQMVGTEGAMFGGECDVQLTRALTLINEAHQAHQDGDHSKRWIKAQIAEAGAVLKDAARAYGQKPKP